MKADKMVMVENAVSITENFRVSGFPWGKEVTVGEGAIGVVNIALIHDYIWVDGAGYDGAPEDHHLATITTAERLKGNTKWKGYDVINRCSGAAYRTSDWDFCCQD